MEHETSNDQGITICSDFDVGYPVMVIEYSKDFDLFQNKTEFCVQFIDISSVFSRRGQHSDSMILLKHLHFILCRIILFLRC